MTEKRYVVNQIQRNQIKAKSLQPNKVTGDGGLSVGPDVPIYRFMNAFNAFANRSKEHEYKTKNPQLFTWKLSNQPFKKITIPHDTLELIKRLETKKLKQPAKNSQQQSHAAKEDKSKNPPPIERQDTSQSQSMIRSKSVHFGSPKKSHNHNVSQETGRETGKESADESMARSTTRARLPWLKTATYEKWKKAVIEPVDLSKYDFSMPVRAKRAYSMVRLQTETIQNSAINTSRRKDSTDREARGERRSQSTQKERPTASMMQKEYMLDPFDRRNLSVNKILFQIEPDAKLYDREETFKQTIAKIKEIVKPYKTRIVEESKNYRFGFVSNEFLPLIKSLR